MSAEKEGWKFVGKVGSAWISPNGTPAICNVVMNTLPAGVEIVGNGTIEHPLDVRLSGEYAAAPELMKALSLWDKFWDDMPKGQLGRIVCDIGLLNDAFIATRAAIAKATKSKGGTK